MTDAKHPKPTFWEWLGRLFTPRRSFAYRALEERALASERDLAEARALISKMYNYILIYLAHLPPVERPEPKRTQAVDGEERDGLRVTASRGHQRTSDIHAKYRAQARTARQADAPRSPDEQRERVAEVVGGAAQNGDNIVPDDDIENAIDDAAAFIRDRTGS